MATEQSLGWRAQAVPRNIDMMRRIWLISCSGIGCIIGNIYLYKKRNDLIGPQQQILKYCNIITFARFILNRLYSNKASPIQTEMIFLAPIMFPLFMTLPIYASKKKKKEENKWNNLENIIYGSLFIFGSFISSYSELQRFWFKQKSENKGKLYINGFYSLTRHPNYFGDVIMNIGWYGLTANIKLMIIPIIMFLNLYFNQIPECEAYLKKKYSDQWISYQNNVKSFVPFIL